MNDVKRIPLHTDMEPEQKIEIFTHSVNGEVRKTMSIAMYSPEREKDWCVCLTDKEAITLAHRILETFSST